MDTKIIKRTIKCLHKCIAKIESPPFAYPSDINVLFGGKNKNVRPIFILVKIEEVINLGPT